MAHSDADRWNTGQTHQRAGDGYPSDLRDTECGRLEKGRRTDNQVAYDAGKQGEGPQNPRPVRQRRVVDYGACKGLVKGPSPERVPTTRTRRFRSFAGTSGTEGSAR